MFVTISTINKISQNSGVLIQIYINHICVVNLYFHFKIEDYD